MLECDLLSRTSEKGAEAAIYGDVSLRISENRLRMDVALSRQGPGFESLTEHPTPLPSGDFAHITQENRPMSKEYSESSTGHLTRG